MRTEGMMETCDWCGRRYFRPHKGTDYTDGGFTKIVCPDCSKELDKSIEEAKLRRIKPPTANTPEGSGILKMVSLDNVKRCADLCIDMGWTLQEFRKNMDEWDEDTIEITETE